MKSSLVAVLVLQDGYKFQSIIRNLPTDPASLFVIVLVVAGVGWVVWAGRRRGKPSA